MSNIITRMNPAALPIRSKWLFAISIVEPGRMAYISGQVAWQPNGEPVPEDLAEQMKLVSKNVRSALDAVGATPGDIVIARVYMVDLTPERLEKIMPRF